MEKQITKAEATRIIGKHHRSDDTLLWVFAAANIVITALYFFLGGPFFLLIALWAALWITICLIEVPLVPNNWHLKLTHLRLCLSGAALVELVKVMDKDSHQYKIVRVLRILIWVMSTILIYALLRFAIREVFV
jgi:hypothetical protein